MAMSTVTVAKDVEPKQTFRVGGGGRWRGRTSSRNCYCVKRTTLRCTRRSYPSMIGRRDNCPFSNVIWSSTRCLDRYYVRFNITCPHVAGSCFCDSPTIIPTSMQSMLTSDVTAVDRVTELTVSTAITTVPPSTPFESHPSFRRSTGKIHFYIFPIKIIPSPVQTLHHSTARLVTTYGRSRPHSKLAIQVIQRFNMIVFVKICSCRFALQITFSCYSVCTSTAAKTIIVVVVDVVVVTLPHQPFDVINREIHFQFRRVTKCSRAVFLHSRTYIAAFLFIDDYIVGYFNCFTNSQMV